MKVYLAICLDGDDLEVLSTHKTRKGAQRVNRNHRARELRTFNKIQKKLCPKMNFDFNMSYYVSEEEVLD